MRLLLDTHVLLWWLMDSPSLADADKEFIETAPQVLVSSVSIWEISIKQAAKKLSVPPTFTETLARSGVGELPISFTHATLAGALPPIHHDPFDRMLVAQALSEQLTLVTRDIDMRRYDVMVRAV